MIPGERYDEKRREAPNHITHWACERIWNWMVGHQGNDEPGCCCSGHECSNSFVTNWQVTEVKGRKRNYG